MKTVLIIDDSKITNMYLARYLKARYKIVQAYTAEAGIELIAAKKPDCILSDLLMPEMDGYQLLEHMKEKDIRVPVVVITSEVNEETKNRCLSMGAFEILGKPLKAEGLLKAVEDAINQLKTY